MTLVTSAAVEATVPDVVRANELGLPHLTRPQFLAKLLNAAQRSVAVGGTSGKSTVTGMIGWILHACHRQPTVMNGAVMKNFVTAVGALRQRAGRRPRAVRQRGRRERRLDRALPARGRGADQHQPRPQGDGRAAQPVRRTSCCAPRKAVLNLDDPETRALADVIPADKRIGYGFDSPGADFMGKDLQLQADGVDFARRGRGRAARRAPGRPRPPQCVQRAGGDRRGARARRAASRTRSTALARFEGLRRRLETVGEAAGVTVIDDFAHNPGQDRRDAGDPARAAGAAADHVPAARLRPARQDGRGAGGQLRQGHGAGRPALSARPGLPGRHGRADARIGLAGRSR